MASVKNSAGLYEVGVGPHTYEFEKWNAEEALDVLLDISTLVGKPLGMLSAQAFGVEGKGLGTELTLQSVDAVSEALIRQLSTHKEMVMRLVKKLGTHKMLCDGAALPPFNEHYKDRLPHLFQVAAAALEVQYGDFFGAVGSVTGIRRGPKPPSEPTTPTAST